MVPAICIFLNCFHYPLESDGIEADGVLYTEDADFDEDVVQAFCSVIQRLCARLDAVDFELTAPLAAGSPWASLEVLKAYRVKTESVGRVNYAFQSVTSTVKAGIPGAFSRCVMCFDALAS